MSVLADDHTQSISASEELARLRLFRSENVGPVTFAGLIKRFGAAARALDALPTLAQRGGAKRKIKIASTADAEKELAAIAKAGAQIIYQGTDAYPSLLAATDGAPPLLTLRGDISALATRKIAMVGARNASAAARSFARTLARELGEADLLTVSGLARGIDTAAHEGALEAGTIAVMAGGVDHVYPPQNQKLYDEICERGAIISEMPWGMQPQARHFPRRNRIVSGLSLGVVVVEAAMKSGSLITARYALEQNREVFAVPGAPSDPRSEGTNRLIKDGAHLITSAADVTDEINALMPCAPLGQQLGFDEDEPMPEDLSADVVEDIHSLLGGAPVRLNTLAREAGLDVGTVAAALLELELAGRVEALPGPAYRRAD